MTLPTACFRKAVLFLRARYGTGPGMNLLFPADFQNVTYISLLPSRRSQDGRRSFPVTSPPAPVPPRDVAFVPAVESPPRRATGKERILCPPLDAQADL